MANLYNFVYGDDKRVAEWVVENLRGATEFKDCVAIGLEKNGIMLAGCVYYNYRKHDIEMTIASISPRWATKKTIAIFLSYPFVQLKVARVTAIAAKANKRARKMLERLGFQLEGVARRGMDGEKDACIYGMLASECKWLRHLNG